MIPGFPAVTQEIVHRLGSPPSNIGVEYENASELKTNGR